MAYTLNDLSGLTKSQAITVITNQQSWSKEFIIHMLNNLRPNNSHLTNKLKVGDVINSKLLHPALIIKIKGNLVVTVLLTTEETTPNILFKCNSRFYPNSYITTTISVTNLEIACSYFRSVYDCNSDIKLIKAQLKAFYKTIL